MVDGRWCWIESEYDPKSVYKALASDYPPGEYMVVGRKKVSELIHRITITK